MEQVTSALVKTVLFSWETNVLQTVKVKAPNGSRVQVPGAPSIPSSLNVSPSDDKVKIKFISTFTGS